MSLIGAIWVELKGRPYIRWRIAVEIEAGREDSDDDVRVAAEQNRFPNDIGVAAEPTLPEAMADDDDMSPAWPVFLGGKRRPFSNAAPNSRNVSALTCAEVTCSGSAPPVRLTAPMPYAETS